ncbi:RagB/SusD family nutrient uptake outer membrane protein [Pseudopedobacter saltans]|nr:RagB/SusD family nutrient uptake outer membrane protein [Pseudopedobacter saltans]
MKKQLLFKFFSILFGATLLLTSCKKSNHDVSQEKFHVRLSGFAEKTLFVVGADVRIIELDERLTETIRQHQTRIGADGRYDTELELQSSLVKIIATGKYYDELTGQESAYPISLEGIVQVGNGEYEANVNVFTHIEQERLKKLLEQRKSMEEAKKEASNQLLELLNVDITNKKQAHEMKFMAGDTESAAMIAFSTMLLNRDKSKVNELLDKLKKDFSNGDLDEELKDELFRDADKIDFEKVAGNLVELYQRYGHQLKPGDIIAPEYPVKTENEALLVVKASMEILMDATKELFVLDALYTRNIDETLIKNNFDYRALYNHTHEPNNTAINNLFKTQYNVVNKSNSIIRLFEKASNIGFNKYHGTVLLNRSLAYLNIITYWGDPIILPVVTNIDDITERMPWKTALNLVITDLKKAEQLLPENGEEYIASKYAARALLARAHLLQKDYLQAKYYLDQIISSSKFKIESDHESVFKLSSKENVYIIAKELDKLENTNTFFERNIRKGELVPLIRYTEILLMAAECNAILKNAVGIEEYLNPVFKRQHGEDLYPGLSRHGAEEIIFGLWMSDLAKEGLSLSVYKRLEVGEYFFEKPHLKILPIPMYEMQLNKYLKQNPGYY